LSKEKGKVPNPSAWKKSGTISQQYFFLMFHTALLTFSGAFLSVVLNIIKSMRPDFPYKIFSDERISYVFLVQALAEHS